MCEFHLHSTDGETEKQSLVNLPAVGVSGRARGSPGDPAPVTAQPQINIHAVTLLQEATQLSAGFLLTDNAGLDPSSSNRVDDGYQPAVCALIVHIENLEFYLSGGLC